MPWIGWGLSVKAKNEGINRDLVPYFQDGSALPGDSKRAGACDAGDQDQQSDSGIGRNAVVIQ